MSGGTQPVAATEPAGEPAAPEPVVDTRNQGQVIVDILTTQSYVCSIEETRWSCMPPGGNWPMYVSYVTTDDPVTIWFDSYTARAFARPCAKFTNAMADLAHAGDFFTASCDDTTQQFRFNTRFSYLADTDVMAWATNHQNRRTTAWTLLDSIKGVRK